MMKRWILPLMTLLVLLGTTAPVPARTITLTALDCDRIACIHPGFPQLSWSDRLNKGIAYRTEALDFGQGMSLLMRFSLDAIPKDQRIQKAELTLMCNYVAGVAKFQAHRVLADWGPGVCHKYARVFPSKVEWTQPGGRGAADRAPRTSMVQMKAPKENTLDVTQDVELWYTKAAPNRGWIFYMENDAGIVYLPSPYWPHGATAKTWKLQVTHEPL
jgi:hypothetical protein